MASTSELAAKHDVLVEDLEYGKAGGSPLLARLYRPRGVTGFPAIVDVHGGAWVANDRLQNAAIDQVIAAAGTAVLALDFRLAPASPYPASVADINLGIRWLKEISRNWAATRAVSAGSAPPAVGINCG
jgi:acetyl esterase/lipase